MELRGDREYSCRPLLPDDRGKPDLRRWRSAAQGDPRNTHLGRSRRHEVGALRGLTPAPARAHHFERASSLHTENELGRDLSVPRYCATNELLPRGVAAVATARPKLNSKEPKGKQKLTEAQIAVHWKEEEYFHPSKKFIA